MKKTEELRIVYVGSPPLFTKGASAIHMMKMCQAMKGIGINIMLIFPDYDKNQDVFEYYGVKNKFEIKTIPFTNLPGRQILHGFLSAVYCWRNKKDFDFVVTRNIVFTYFATKWFGIKTIYDAHHPLVNEAARHIFKSFKDSSNLIEFSTNSGGLADIYLEEGLDRKKLVVAHNGVDIERFNLPETLKELREELGLPQDKKIVCYSGNTYQGRGIELLIDAAAAFPEVYFLVVGGLEEDNTVYEQQAKNKKINNFRLTGFVPHSSVPKYLKASDVLVIPYTNEITIKGGTQAAAFTSPIKLFEYMAAKKPILSSALPTILEILEDRKTGSLYQPGNFDSFCNKLREILGNNTFSNAISENAEYKAREYTWEARVRKILKIPF